MPSSENAKDYEWLWQEWIKATGCALQVLFSDAAYALLGSVPRVFPPDRTAHFLCLFHIYKNLTQTAETPSSNTISLLLRAPSDRFRSAQIRTVLIFSGAKLWRTPARKLSRTTLESDQIWAAERFKTSLSPFSRRSVAEDQLQSFFSLVVNACVACSCAVFRSLLGPQSAYRHPYESANFARISEFSNFVFFEISEIRTNFVRISYKSVRNSYEIRANSSNSGPKGRGRNSRIFVGSRLGPMGPFGMGPSLNHGD